MKKNIFGILLLGLAVTACNNDYSDWYQDEPNAEANAPMEALQNVKVEPFVSSVIVSWDKPASDQYYYTLLSWTDNTGSVQNRKISKYSEDSDDPGRISAIVGGFTDTSEYEFTLVACSYSGIQSEPVRVKAAPQSGETAKDYVLSTVSITPGEESANITWKNEINATINLEVSYTDKYGDAQVVTIDASVPKTETITSLPVEKITELSIKAIDPGYQIETEPVIYEVEPLLTKWDKPNDSWNYICRSLWSNPGPTNLCTLTYNNDEKTEFTVYTTGNDPYCWWENYTALGTKFVMRYKADHAFTFQIFLSFPPLPSVAPTLSLRQADNWETVEWDLTGQFGSWDGGFIYPRFDWGADKGVTIQVRNGHFE